MLTFRQGTTIAKEAGMRYEPGWDYTAGREDTSMHVFRTDKMDSRSCWVDHTFYFADSVQECLEQKQNALLSEESPLFSDPDDLAKIRVREAEDEEAYYSRYGFDE